MTTDKQCSGKYDDGIADGNLTNCSSVAGCGYKGCPSKLDRYARIMMIQCQPSPSPISFDTVIGESVNIDSTVYAPSPEDIDNLKEIRKAINRTAYYGGLGLRESGRYLTTMDRLLKSFGVGQDE